MRDYEVIAYMTLCLLFSSCYTVTIVSEHGVGEEAAIPSGNHPIFRSLEKVELDTIIKSNISQPNIYYVPDDCPTNSFYGIEHKVTLGSYLLNVVTFGKRKRVKITYVCTKENTF